MSPNVTSVNEQTFAAEVVNSPTPTLVDFHATWCGPCRMLAPMFEQLAAEFAGRIRFVKVDIDEAPGIAADHRITGVPTLLLFQNGSVVDQIVGMQPPQLLRSRLNVVLATEVTCRAEPRRERGRSEIDDTCDSVLPSCNARGPWAGIADDADALKQPVLDPPTDSIG